MGAGSGGVLTLWFDLEQQGARVKGFLQYQGAGGAGLPADSASLDGTVTGDVFRFKPRTRSGEGEFTVDWGRDVRSSVDGGRIPPDLASTELIHPLARLGDGASASKLKPPGKPQGFRGVFYHRPMRQRDPAALFNPPSRGDVPVLADTCTKGSHVRHIYRFSARIFAGIQFLPKMATRASL